MPVPAIPALAAPSVALLLALALTAGRGAAQEQSPAPPQPPEAAAPGEAAEDAGPGDPDPFEIVLASAGFLADLPAFGFDWFVSYDIVDEEREKLTFTRSGSNLIARDVGFFATAEEGFRLRDYYYDGATFTIAAPQENFYANAPFDGGFEALVTAVRVRTGTVLPLWSVMSRDLPARLTEGAEAAAYIGLTRIAGQTAHHIAFAGETEDWQIWIAEDAGRPVPLLIVGTETDEQGWPQFRAWLSNWDLAPEIAPERFVFEPDEDDLPASMPDLEVGRPGTAAPSPARRPAPADGQAAEEAQR